jgi:hypothetical protein
MLMPTNVIVDAAIAAVGPANAIAYAMKDIQCEWKDMMAGRSKREWTR